MSALRPSPALLWPLLVACLWVSVAPRSAALEMVLYGRLTYRRPSWRHSLANFTADTECTCLLRCLVDGRCLSVFLYPGTNGTGGTTSPHGTPAGTSGPPRHTNGTSTSAATSATTARGATGSPPTAAVTGDTSSAGTSPMAIHRALSYIIDFPTDVNSTPPTVTTDGPVTCQLFAVAHGDLNLQNLWLPAGGKFCSRRPTELKLFKELLGRCLTVTEGVGRRGQDWR